MSRRLSARQAWTQLALLFLTAIVAYTDRQVLSLMVEPVKLALHLDDVQIGVLIGTAFGVIYAIAGLPLGLLVDRLSRRWLLIAGVLIWSVGTIGCGLAGSFAGLFTSRLLVGIGEAVLSPAAVSMIGDMFPPRLQGRALGIYFMGIEAGAGASLVIGGLLLFLAAPLVPLAPWRGVFALLGGAGLLLALLLLALLREPARTIAPQLVDPAAATRDVASRLLRLLPIYLAVALMSLLENALGAWAPTMLVRRAGLDVATSGLLLGPFIIAGGSIGVLAGGWFADRMVRISGQIGKIRLLAAVCVAYVPISLFLLLPAVSVTLPAVGALFVVSGFVTALGLSTIIDLVPPARRGFATAAAFFLNVLLGAGLGPVLTPLTAHWIGGAQGSFAAALVVLSIATMLPSGAALLAAGRAGRGARA
jgi:MFS family permease